MDTKEELTQIIQEHILVPYKREIAVFTPSYRHMLYLIARDKRTLNGNHYIEVLKLYGHDRVKHHNLGEVIRIFNELKTKGYIKPTKFYEGNKITLKGQLYRLYTNPSLPFWGIIIGAIVALLIYILEQQSKSPTQ